eukprot:1778583-Amphidinium_carterae.2
MLTVCLECHKDRHNQQPDKVGVCTVYGPSRFGCDQDNVHKVGLTLCVHIVSHSRGCRGGNMAL